MLTQPLIFHSANQRGYAEFSWLKSFHSFSFGQFFDAQKMGFGMLRVLNVYGKS
jgi:hypothetical protein